eukprot:TRINITY_DN2819_c0_g1_i16.p1 TRINITY_DN2819_c0_g1~~TRINITY_DN2819_c0_g1_i16.p1  ORF type:complete len:204 (-),score=23.12 TRINITY_DN2819_c0_g1_i16:192-803(-)
MEQVASTPEKKTEDFCISNFMADTFKPKRLFSSGDRVKPIVYKAPKSTLEPKPLPEIVKNKKTEGVLGKIGKVTCNTFLKPKIKLQCNFKPTISLWSETAEGNCQGINTIDNKSVKTIGTAIKSTEGSENEDMKFITPMKIIFTADSYSGLFLNKSHSQRQSRRSALDLSSDSLLSPNKAESKEFRQKIGHEISLEDIKAGST